MKNKNTTPTAIKDADPGFTPQQIQQMITSLDTIINQIDAKTPTTNTDIFGKRSITPRNLAIVESAELLAEQYPNTRSKAIDITEWSRSLDRANELETVIQRADLLRRTAIRYERSYGIEAIKYFNYYYRCIRTLRAEGILEAESIFSTIREMYSNLFGKRGPNCPCKVVDAALEYAHEVIVENKDKLLKLAKDQKLLEDDLNHLVHDEIVIERGHYINKKLTN